MCKNKQYSSYIVIQHKINLLNIHFGDWYHDRYKFCFSFDKVILIILALDFVVACALKYAIIIISPKSGKEQPKLFTHVK